MYYLILAFVAFHTLSSLSLLALCGFGAFLPAPRATSHVWVDQMELDADSILSAPVGAAAEQSFSPGRAAASVAAVA